MNIYQEKNKWKIKNKIRQIGVDRSKRLEVKNKTMEKTMKNEKQIENRRERVFKGLEDQD